MPNPLRDPLFRRDIVNGLLGLGNDVSRGAVTGLLGAPVDIATMAMRPFGYSAQKPVMGSEWLDDRMVQAGIYQPKNNSLKQQAAMLAGGLLNPGGVPVASAKAAALAKGLLSGKSLGVLGLGSVSKIRASQPETEALRRWFGDSKMVDKQGQPLMVSHYTDADRIDSFDRSFLGSNTEWNTDQPQASKMARLGFWFSDADVRYTKDRRRGMFAKNKVDAYLSSKSPKEYATFDDMWADSENYDSAEKWLNKLESDGYDGIVVRDDTELGGTSYVVFRPEQIKVVPPRGGVPVP